MLFNIPEFESRELMKKIQDGVYDSFVYQTLEMLGYRVKRDERFGVPQGIPEAGAELVESSFHPGEKFWSASSYYGVCDDLDQILALYPCIQEPDRRFVVSMSYVDQQQEFEEFGPYGGWRWSHQGNYIGTYTPTHDYLAFEDIEGVYTYSVYELE